MVNSLNTTCHQIQVLLLCLPSVLPFAVAVAVVAVVAALVASVVVVAAD